MNPSYMAMNKAVTSSLLNLAMGTKYTPKDKRDPNVGPAFAKGIQQEAPSEAKEAKVKAHLDKLASEAKARYNLSVDAEMNKAIDFGDNALDELVSPTHHQEWDDDGGARLVLDTPEKLRQIYAEYPRSDMVKEMEETQARFDKLEEDSRKRPDPYWSPSTQQDVDSRNVKAANAAIHSGERANIKWHQQG